MAGKKSNDLVDVLQLLRPYMHFSCYWGDRCTGPKEQFWCSSCTALALLERTLAGKPSTIIDTVVETTDVLQSENIALKTALLAAADSLDELCKHLFDTQEDASCCAHGAARLARKAAE